MNRTDFGNAAILRWLSYFSEYDELDLATLLILDITRQNKNLIPCGAVHPSGHGADRCRSPQHLL